MFIFARLRHAIRSSPLLYRVWLVLSKSYSYKFPNRGTDLHLTGFQRSGNTFASILVKRVFPNLNIVTHFHAIASLKCALKNNTPILVLIRDPSQCVLSSFVKRIDSSNISFKRAVEFDIMEYKYYYSFVRHHEIQLVDFEVMINDPYLFVMIVCEKLGLEPPSRQTVFNAVRETHEILDKDTRTGGDRNIGSEYKQAMKNKLSSHILSRSEFTDCVALYEETKSTF